MEHETITLSRHATAVATAERKPPDAVAARPVRPSRPSWNCSATRSPSCPRASTPPPTSCCATCTSSISGTAGKVGAPAPTGSTGAPASTSAPRARSCASPPGRAPPSARQGAARHQLAQEAVYRHAPHTVPLQGLAAPVQRRRLRVVAVERLECRAGRRAAASGTRRSRRSRTCHAPPRRAWPGAGTREYAWR